MTAKPTSVKGTECKSSGCALKAVELTSGDLPLVLDSRLRSERSLPTRGQESAKGARRQQIAESLPARDAEDWSEGFAEVLRHEPNNPLTGILGNAELLLADDSGAGHEDARNGKTVEPPMGNEKRPGATNLSRKPGRGNLSATECWLHGIASARCRLSEPTAFPQ
jgi:hypothetical protein